MAPKPATYDDILALPPHVVGELVGGELVVSPRPAAHHARTASVLGMDLGSPFLCEVTSPRIASLDRVRVEPFEAVELELGALWGEEPPL